MKGSDKVIELLNARLSEELGAINQYMVHSEMCENWNYERLSLVIKKRSITEMRHAEKLIERILFLEGRPFVSNLGPIKIGPDVPTMHEHDRDAELDAVKNYNDSVQSAAEAGDHATKVMLESILSDEEDHLDWLEAQFDQIEQMGLPQYLAEQIG
jgi:bacterioferritin